MVESGEQMPVYEYRCTECRKVQEFILKMGEEPEHSSCLACKKGRLIKLISAPSSCSRMSDSAREFEAYAMEQGGRKLARDYPDHWYKDKDGHWVEGDPNAPKTNRKKDEAS